MAKKKKEEAVAEAVEVVEAPVAEAETVEAPAPTAKPVGDSITVKFRDHRGEPTERTYSRADHGENFAELAEQFKTKHAARLIK
jgi:hypothetical protein